MCMHTVRSEFQLASVQTMNAGVKVKRLLTEFMSWQWAKESGEVPSEEEEEEEEEGGPKKASVHGEKPRTRA